ncbi:MAG: rhodanese-like domain-containing protein [Candidatus Thiodiazotropha sp. (ex Ctena orbiculata)]|uniref:Rhodanese-like domain-containing protein n=1 Tax=Candidatus Thiodiazotropha taylori TaxID=2792791 RepID=A0A944QRG0_9GAMM|nr:rhodanese-like domain-containing protein [Candidatus Thiodiazotropha taylori]MBV2135854.1 rhodanese-like domain-containing protein [Candidatus Thiodiazotropha taylori]
MERANVSTISPSKLYAMQSQGGKVDLLDVRTGMEYSSGHIPGAKLLTLDEISDESLIEHLGDPKERDTASIYVTCQSGFRAQQAVEQLHESGYQNLVLVEGGTEGWEKAGLPVKRCGKVISLERQVQIAIGSLLLLKVFFGFTLHELFFLAGALIGAGLIMAGGTRWCGMARLIATMPWNRNNNCAEKAFV